MTRHRSDAEPIQAQGALGCRVGDRPAGRFEDGTGLSLGQPGGFDLSPWAGRVQLAEAAYDGPWELPVLGLVPPPAAVLIRPDGYVAWAASPDTQGNEGLRQALTTWFGTPDTG